MGGELGCEEEVCQLCRTLDSGRQEGTCGPEDQGLLRAEEGLSTVHQGEGVLPKLSGVCCVNALKRQLQVWDILRLSSAWRLHSISCWLHSADSSGSADSARG